MLNQTSQEYQAINEYTQSLINQYKMDLNLFLNLLLSFVLVSTATELNNRPIVGVLLQEQSDNVNQYVASSYVKFIEMGGARVVPIFVHRKRSYYTHLLDQINGVLMPGGGTPLLNTGYSEAADLIFEIAMAKFNVGIYFPVWTICLSFEKVITYFTGNNLNWESRCKVQNLSLNLDFPGGLELSSTRMLKNAGPIVNFLANFPVTPNYHIICLDVDTFKANKNLTDQFTLISTNYYNGAHFVSTIEHKKYPIYGVQWHPEKAQFEWVVSKTVGGINHDWRSIEVGQYFGHFLVNESRRNNQHFASQEEEIESLIYNYIPNLKYTAKAGRASFMEKYVFPIEDSDGTTTSYENMTFWVVVVAMVGIAVVGTIIYFVIRCACF